MKTALERLSENRITAPETCTLDSLLHEFGQLQLKIVHEIVEYPYKTITCREKFTLWEKHYVKEKIRSHHGDQYNFEIIKSLLLKYQQSNQDKYILACTLSSKKVDFSELRVEFGFSRAEAESLSYKNIDEATLLSITGCRRGEITPLIAEDKLKNMEMIYFSRDLMLDAINNTHKLYDFPLTLQRSLFVNAANLFFFLQRRNNKYKTASDLQGGASFDYNSGNLKVVKWKAKKVTNAGYPYIFTGTELQFRGQEYVIKNPRFDHGCIALPFSRDDRGKQFEHQGMKTQRVLLPINYKVLLDQYWLEHPLERKE